MIWTCCVNIAKYCLTQSYCFICYYLQLTITCPHKFILMNIVVYVVIFRLYNFGLVCLLFVETVHLHMQYME